MLGVEFDQVYLSFFLSKSVETSSRSRFIYPKVFAEVEQCLLLRWSCTCDRIRKENVKACRVNLNLTVFPISNLSAPEPLQFVACKANANKHSQIMDGEWQCCYRKWEMLIFLHERASRGQSPRLIGFFKLSSNGCSPLPLSIIATPITFAQSIIFQQQQLLSAPSL